MKAIVFEQTGDPSVLKYVEVPKPELAPGTVAAQGARRRNQLRRHLLHPRRIHDQTAAARHAGDGSGRSDRGGRTRRQGPEARDARDLDHAQGLRRVLPRPARAGDPAARLRQLRGGRRLSDPGADRVAHPAHRASDGPRPDRGGALRRRRRRNRRGADRQGSRRARDRHGVERFQDRAGQGSTAPTR